MSEIKRGTICVDGHERLFVITVDEPRPVTWNGDSAGVMWAGAVFMTGEYTLCSNPKVVAPDFKTWVADFATKVGLKAADAEILEIKKTLGLL